MRHFRPIDLKRHLDGGAMPMLLDVREPWEYEKCHLNDSTLIPMQEIPKHLEELRDKNEIVVICHHGMRSQQVGMYLEQQGIENIINLYGGIDAWAQEVDQSMPTY